MRPQKVEERELLDKLFAVIRAKGYEGARLSELAELTGLKKASLYHRFPGGKKDIIKAVLEDVDAWSQKHVIGVFESPTLDADQKLETVLANIDMLYHQGEKTCIYRSLSLENGLDHFELEIRGGIKSWIEAFKYYGESIGLNRHTAERKATEAIALMQGSLMVSKIMNDKSVWKDALESMEDLYN
ncbi:MAG: TetR/AcrR family transcriptional regulator [Flavobacteriaceae bacterium]